MNEYIKLILSLSLSGTILAILFFSIKPWIKNKVSKAFLYYIWLIVLVRFLCPVSIGNSMMNQLFHSVSPDSVYTKAETELATPEIQSKTAPALQTQQNDQSMQKRDDTLKSTQPTGDPGAIAIGIWMAGVMMSAAWHILAYCFFISKVKKQQFPASVEEKTILSNLTTKPISLAHSRYIHVPMLIGLRKPVIVLPARQYSSVQLANIFTHELCHRNRKDIAYKWFAMLVSCVHWFNPILLLISSEIGRNCELACDERVIAQLNSSEKQIYGETLLHMVYADSCKRGKPLVSMFTEKKNIKERLVSIMKSYQRTKRTVLIMCLMAALALTLSVTLGAAAVGNPSKNACLLYSQEYIAGSGNIKGNVNTESFSDKGKEFEIGANQYGYAVFKNPAAALAKLKKDYKAGIELIQKEEKLLPLSQFNYHEYETYGWQITTGTREEREQAFFVTGFMDIYENSFSNDVTEESDAYAAEAQTTENTIVTAAINTTTTVTNQPTKQTAATAAQTTSQTKKTNVSEPSVSSKPDSSKSSVPTAESNQKITFQYPLTGKIEITSPYGMKWGTMHRGVDMKADMGTPVYAAAAGTVTSVEDGWYGGYGNTVIIMHGSGDATLYSVYAHLNDSTVNVGQTVNANQRIGSAGESGDCTGPHLHFEIQSKDKVAVDPAAYLNY